MKIKLNNRHLTLGVALAATLSSVIYVNDLDNAADTAITPTKNNYNTDEHHPKHPSYSTKEELQNRIDIRTPSSKVRYTEHKNNIFSEPNWQTDPKKISAIQVEPTPLQIAPHAPPLPFSYLGKMLDGDTVTFFISKGESNYIVRIGDIIEKTYKIVDLTSAGLLFTYLPLNISQTLPIKESK